MVRIHLFLLGVCLIFSSRAIDLTRVDMAWQYDVNAALKIAHRVYEDEVGIHLLLHLKKDMEAHWSYEFLNQQNYRSKAHAKVEPLKLDTLSGGKNRVIVSLLFPKTLKDLLIVRAVHPEREYYYDIGIRIGNISFPPFFPIGKDGLPIFTSYVNHSGHHWSIVQELHFMKYREDFDRADPPMAKMKPIAPRAPLDSAFVASDTTSFQEGFFYKVRSDSNASSGVTLLKVPPYFPEYRRLPELVQSLLYITNKSEEKAIKKSRDLRKDFDAFWIKNFNTKTSAKHAIRKYYERVKKANILFTDYKAGWKTDRGMMYIIYGAPDEVYKQNGLEEWHYDGGAVFKFSVISTFFAPQTYSLRREKGFEESWFKKVREIRRSINE